MHVNMSELPFVGNYHPEHIIEMVDHFPDATKMVSQAEQPLAQPTAAQRAGAGTWRRAVLVSAVAL